MEASEPDTVFTSKRACQVLHVLGCSVLNCILFDFLMNVFGGLPQQFQFAPCKRGGPLASASSVLASCSTMDRSLELDSGGPQT
jgi:hypothetical protein